MVAENTNEQLELGFAAPEEFDSYDDVDSEEGQAELSKDSFDGSNLHEDDEPEEGCCVR